MAENHKTKSELIEENRALRARVAALEARAAGGGQDEHGESGPRRYEAAVESAPDIIAAIDRDYVYTLANEAFLRAHGTRREEVIGRTVAEVMGAEAFAKQIKRHVDRCLGGRDVQYEMVHRFPDGSRRCLEVNYHPLGGTSGGPTGLVAVIRDITARRGAEEALRRSEATYRALVESIPAVTYVADVDRASTTLYVSPQIERYIGFTPEQYKADPDIRRQRLHPADRDRVLAEVARAHATGEPLACEYRMIARDGREVWFRDEATVIRDEHGRAQFIQGVMFDITERKAAEEHERFLVAVTEQVTDSVIVTDADYAIIYVNRAAQELFGYRLDELLGRRPDVLNAEGAAAEIQEEIYRVVAAGRTYMGTWLNRRKDGSTFMCEFKVSPLADECGRKLGYVGIQRDVTERLRMEEQLRHSQKMEAVGKLAGGIAHEFNNLLMGVIGYVYHMLKEVEPGSQAYEDVLQIRKLADRGAVITRQLLAHSRQLPSNPVALDLGSVVADTARMLQRTIGEDIRLELVRRGEVGTVRADRAQMEQVLVNLALNARDAMPTGGTLRIETHSVTLDEGRVAPHEGPSPGPYVMLSVADTGCGMDDQTLKRAFEPFFTTKQVGQGTGLGLSTVYGLVKQHGGLVEVDSRPGEGTTVRIYLPRCDEQPAEAAPRPQEPSAFVGGETVLVVDDEETIAKLVSRHLADVGYEVLTATSAAQAERIFAEHGGQVSLLLTDVVMPDLSGRQLYERLCAFRPSLRVLYMTAYPAEVVDREQLASSGAVVLGKPIRPDELAGKVRAVLDGTAQPPPAEM